jgi:hypothetical protein
MCHLSNRVSNSTQCRDNMLVCSVTLQVRRQFARQRIYVDALASCKSLVGMLAQHGSEHGAQEALQLFEGFVKLRVVPPETTVGNLPTHMVLRGRATGQRLRSSAEADSQDTKRRRVFVASARG